MDYRNGKCSSCGADYKIPASFAHDVAKCKQCSGVVRIEPAQPVAQPAEPMPAKRVEKRPEPVGPVEVQAGEAEKKRKERGTLAKLRAQRAAAAQGQAAPAAKPEPAAAPKPAAARPKPAAARPKPVGAGARRGGAAKPAAKARAGASASRSRKPSGKKRGGDGDEGGSSRRGAKQPPKKGLPVGGLIGIAAIVIGLVGAGLYFGGFIGGGDEVAAEETAAAETPVEATTPEEIPDPEPEDLDPEPEEAPEETPEPEAPKPKAPADPDSVRLDEIEDFGPARGTTDEEWTELNELMATFMDLDAGAKGPRAGRKLQEYGRKAYPVIVNHMKTLDFATEQGFRKGDMCQKALEKILNGRNFGWKYETEEDYVYFDKKVVENYAKSWRQVIASVDAWINMAKLEDKDPDEAARLRAEYGEGTEEPAAEDEFGGGDDDLDVD